MAEGSEVSLGGVREVRCKALERVGVISYQEDAPLCFSHHASNSGVFQLSHAIADVMAVVCISK